MFPAWSVVVFLSRFAERTYHSSVFFPSFSHVRAASWGINKVSVSGHPETYMNYKDRPETYPFKMGHLPPEFVLKAEMELNENPGIKEAAVKQVKEFLRRERGLEEEWFSDDDIIMFLRWRKFDVRATCSSIRKKVKFVKSHSKFFGSMSPELIGEMIRTGMVGIVPHRDEEGCTICHVKLGKWHPSEFTYEDVLKLIAMVFLHTLNDPMTQVNGVKVIYDFKAPLLRYMRYINPVVLYEIYQLYYECMPMRIKQLHGVNPNLVMKLAFRFIITFASEKIMRRVLIHNDHDQLLKHLQADVVPEEYGGKLAENECRRDWIEELSPPTYVTAILDSLEPKSKD